MKRRKLVLTLVSVVAIAVVIVVAAAAIRLSVLTNRIRDDDSAVLAEEKYKAPVSVCPQTAEQ